MTARVHSWLILGYNTDWLCVILFIIGERMCMHVHGVFPYLYVALEHDPDESYLQKLAQAIDKAINLSLGRPSSYTQHVFSISAVHGM